MNIVPQLVYDTELKRICIQIKLGSQTATQELPDHLATATKEELQVYLNGVVPEMINGLKAQQKATRKTVWKKANQ